MNKIKNIHIKFKKEDVIVGYGLATKKKDGYIFHIIRCKKPYTKDDLKNSKVVNSDTGDVLCTLDNLIKHEQFGILFIKKKIFIGRYK
jgi:hypothetical protein